MRKGGAEVRAVDRAVAGGFRRVDVLAAAAIQLDGLFVGNIGETYRKERLRLTEYAWAAAKVCALVFLELRSPRWTRDWVYAWELNVCITHHFCQPPCSDYPSRVNQTVEEPSLKVEVPAKVVLYFFV